jgi:hypothetical protein
VFSQESVKILKTFGTRDNVWQPRTATTDISRHPMGRPNGQKGGRKVAERWRTCGRQVADMWRTGGGHVADRWRTGGRQVADRWNFIDILLIFYSYFLGIRYE